MTLWGIIIALIFSAILLPFLRKFVEMDATLMKFVYALIGLAIALYLLAMFAPMLGFPSVRLN